MALNTQETLKPAQPGKPRSTGTGRNDKRFAEVSAEPMFAQLTKKAETAGNRNKQ